MLRSKQLTCHRDIVMCVWAEVGRGGMGPLVGEEEEERAKAEAKREGAGITGFKVCTSSNCQFNIICLLEIQRGQFHPNVSSAAFIKNFKQYLHSIIRVF